MEHKTVVIAGGTFLRDGNEIKVSPFEMMVTVVTFEHYLESISCALRDSNKSRHPVTKVSWHAAVKYAKWLSKETGETWRLPTSDEWEYACRAGTDTNYSFGNLIGKNDANYDSDGVVDVGSYKPNSWGLYDMHGNVWEWCSDKVSKSRSMKGGGWNNYRESTLPENKCHELPTAFSNDIGFRLVKEIDFSQMKDRIDTLIRVTHSHIAITANNELLRISYPKWDKDTINKCSNYISYRSDYLDDYMGMIPYFYSNFFILFDLLKARWKFVFYDIIDKGTYQENINKCEWHSVGELDILKINIYLNDNRRVSLKHLKTFSKTFREPRGYDATMVIVDEFANINPITSSDIDKFLYGDVKERIDKNLTTKDDIPKGSFPPISHERISKELKLAKIIKDSHISIKSINKSMDKLGRAVKTTNQSLVEAGKAWRKEIDNNEAELSYSSTRMGKGECANRADSRGLGIGLLSEKEKELIISSGIVDNYNKLFGFKKGIKMDIKNKVIENVTKLKTNWAKPQRTDSIHNERAVMYTRLALLNVAMIGSYHLIVNGIDGSMVAAGGSYISGLGALGFGLVSIARTLQVAFTTLTGFGTNDYKARGKSMLKNGVISAVLIGTTLTLNPNILHI